MTTSIRDLKVENTAIAWLKPDPQNARTHSKKQIAQVAASIQQFGWTNPILIDADNRVIAGHARLEAAKELGLQMAPTIRIGDLTPAQRRAYVIADNKLAENAGWDFDILKSEFQAIGALDVNFDMTLTGFEMGKIDVSLAPPAQPERKLKLVESTPDEADIAAPAEPERPTVTRPGDLWQAGKHRLLCANSLDVDNLALLMEHVPADMAFTDPPYNVPIAGHVCGLGSVSHAEFAMASGEMSGGEFKLFLGTTMQNLSDSLRDGAIAYVCMDWRHIHDLIPAGLTCFSELKNICVWNKTNAGMGSLYRSKHELVCVFKNGSAPHINNVELGKHGRNRTNVWDYPGVNGFGEERQHLAIHPTVKPVQLVADAIMDCSKRGDRILDPFCGSVAAIFVGRFGDMARRKNLNAIYPKLSGYIQAAIYFSSRSWPGVERSNARASWGKHTQLNALITAGIANQQAEKPAKK